MSSEKVSSPTRRYVAICNKTNFDGHYLKQFTLPKSYMGTLCHECQKWEFGEFSLCPSCGSNQVAPVAGTIQNNAEKAAWYFLNRLDTVACVEMIITQEAYDSLYIPDGIRGRCETEQDQEQKKYG